jgi:hypothetical protein
MTPADRAEADALVVACSLLLAGFALGWLVATSSAADTDCPLASAPPVEPGLDDLRAGADALTMESR